VIKRSQQGSLKDRFGGGADVDGGLRTVTDLIALLSTLLSPFATARLLPCQPRSAGSGSHTWTFYGWVRAGPSPYARIVSQFGKQHCPTRPPRAGYTGSVPLREPSVCPRCVPVAIRRKRLFDHYATR